MTLAEPTSEPVACESSRFWILAGIPELRCLKGLWPAVRKLVVDSTVAANACQHPGVDRIYGSGPQ